MKSFWLIVVGVCGLAAAYFAFKSDFDKVFIAATLGAVAWFLSYREILKSRLNDEEEEP
ncbi:MAG TPA: hypothetical protein VFB65_14330 [Pyrinomonadaceae bacterium]|nr:hypothetical protein [Pyrinomonadaceae bacterium]